jgi:NADPH2:quinone reductase
LASTSVDWINIDGNRVNLNVLTSQYIKPTVNMTSMFGARFAIRRAGRLLRMRAVVVRAFGGPEQLKVIEVPDPVPAAGQVRIAVHVAGTNPVDAGNRADGSWAGVSVPFIPGYDVAGVVDRVGPGVTGVSAGDRVMAMTHFPGGAGGYAELAVVDAGQVARIDDATSFADAAATPLAAGTAAVVLDRLALPAGGRLVVLGASGGVGLFLLQLAAAAGLDTVAVGRAAMHDTMSRLGAGACVDYQADDFPKAAGDADAVADLVGGDLLNRVVPGIRPRGALASIALPELDLDPVLDRNLTFHGVLVHDDGERTRRLARLLADGTLRPVVSQTFPLAEAAAAHELLERGHAGGKVLLAVR